MNNYLKVALGVLAAGALGYGFGRYVQPAKVQIKKELEIREIETIKKDIVVVEKIITRPDGTVETERRTEDRSSESTRTDSRSKESTTITNSKPQWRVQGMVGYNGSSFSQPMYGAGIERRILGPISAGLWGNTEKQFGLSVGFEF